MLTRRNWIKQSASLALLSPLADLNVLQETRKKKKYRIGACDWSIGKNSDVGAFEVARQIGLDGIQVNMGGEKNNLHLRRKDMQQLYLQISKHTGVKIASIAIGELNLIPYKSDPRTEEWVWDSIDAAKNLGVEVILLAFFMKNDLRNDEAGKKEVIKRLKIAAPKAEKMGITLGIESYLNADEHLDIVQQVGSKSIKVYMDFRNTADAGYDVIKEVKKIGKDLLCEFHMKEHGALLGKGTLDWQQIKNTLDEIGYKGDKWMQIEGALPEKTDVVESYKANLEYLRKLFE
ncbi:MAG: sugar phosphate isomerase/epimerase family protein [Chitinophagaceae bacterium]|nr:sugar phosphate isomerase/epimerase family protein [Chitinophagaceae bacterium]